VISGKRIDPVLSEDGDFVRMDWQRVEIVKITANRVHTEPYEVVQIWGDECLHASTRLRCCGTAMRGFARGRLRMSSGGRRSNAAVAVCGRADGGRMIVGPETVVIAHLYHPIRFPDDGPIYYKVETTSGRYFAFSPPKLRDADKQPTVLHEELAPGSTVRLAIGRDGLIEAVQIVTACWYDPFAESQA
jgi:hypothetical protein